MVGSEMGTPKGWGWGVELAREVWAGEPRFLRLNLGFLIMEPLYRREEGESSSVERPFINK